MSKRRIRGVDLYSGAGGFSTGLVQAVARVNGYLDLTAVNHWDVAVHSHALNHPKARHFCESLQSMRPAKAVPGGRLDILLAGPSCFPADTLVMTKTGLVPIQEVAIGDLVLTHKGRYRQVTDTSSKLRKTIVVKGAGHYGLETTPEHPIYCRAVRQAWNNAERRPERVWSQPDWVSAAETRNKRNYWATPAVYPDAAVPLPPGCAGAAIPPALLWGIGLWLADGWRDKRPGKRGGGIFVACEEHEVAERLARMREAFPSLAWKAAKRSTCWKLSAHSVKLSRWLLANFGQGASGKFLPPWVLSLPEALRKSLLDGYLAGDGSYIAKRTTWTASTVSKRLAVGLRMLGASLGLGVGVTFVAKAGAGTIQGRDVTLKDQYCLRWTSEPKHTQSYFTDAALWSPIREIKCGRPRVRVHNLQVAEDESYVADGLIVHNCVNHSSARGNLEVDDQDRASAWCVTRWASDLRIDRIVIENIPRFLKWGPLKMTNVMVDGKRARRLRPDPEREGEIFEAFIASLRSIGYTVDWRILDAADYGDATNRLRLFIQAIRGKHKITWPEPTHAKHPTGKQKPWRTARQIIDWNLPSRSIFARDRPLAANTLKRVYAGFEKQGPAAEPFLALLRGGGNLGAGGHRSVDRPTPTITGQGNHLAVCEPFLLPQFSGSQPRKVDRPVSTICSTTRGMALVRPFTVQMSHGSAEPGRMARDVDRPMATITSAYDRAVVEPFVLNQQAGGAPSREIDRPVPTIAGAGAHAVVEPFVARLCGEGWDDGRVRNLAQPLSTVTGKNAHAVVEPFLARVCGGGGVERRVRNLDQPVATILGSNAHAVVEPFVTPYYGTGVPDSIDDPLATITSRDRFALVEPKGVAYDILLRMMQPGELMAATGFPSDYKLEGTKENIVKMIGNAVPVTLAEELTFHVLTAY